MPKVMSSNFGPIYWIDIFSHTYSQTKKALLYVVKVCEGVLSPEEQ